MQWFRSSRAVVLAAAVQPHQRVRAGGRLSLIATAITLGCMSSAAIAQLDVGAATISKLGYDTATSTQTVTTVYDVADAPNNFSTFDGNSGFTISFDATGQHGRVLLQSTAPDSTAANPHSVGVGGRVDFTVPIDQSLKVTADAANTGWAVGVLGISPVTGAGFFTEIGDGTGAPPIVQPGGSTVLGPGTYYIWCQMSGVADASGTGGLRQMAMQFDVTLPEPTVLGAVGFTALLGRRRRRSARR